MTWILLSLACSPETTGSVDSGATGSVAHSGPTGEAFAEPACGPDDGPAVQLVVGQQTEGCDAEWVSLSHVRITLYARSAPLEVGSYPFDASSGGAWYGLNGGTEEYGPSGSVTVSAWDDTDFSGAYEVRLESGDSIEGHFRGTWCDAAASCG